MLSKWVRNLLYFFIIKYIFHRSFIIRNKIMNNYINNNAIEKIIKNQELKFFINIKIVTIYLISTP